MSTGDASALHAQLPDRGQLEALFRQKYGDPAGSDLGWGPRMRLGYGHFNPDDHYEALVARLVRPDTRWLDIGCGRELFPSNPDLARTLSGRCQLLVGVDPDPTLDENPYVHERVLLPFDRYAAEGGRRYDLITLRMVAEHVAEPRALVQNLAHCLEPDGLAVVYTVDGWSPVPLFTRLVPMALRHPVKRFLWGTEEKDTFPTCFRMNRRGTLRRLFAEAGMDERAFARLDDCRSTGRFRLLQHLELGSARALRAVGLGYPEACLLGVYGRRGDSSDLA